MAVVLVAAGAIGVAAAGAYAAIRRATRPNAAPARTVLARGISYLALACALAVAVLTGVVGVAVLLGGIAAVALLEWARLAELPLRHVVAIQLANAVVFLAVAWRGTAAADVLVGGLAFAAALLPVAPPTPLARSATSAPPRPVSSSSP